MISIAPGQKTVSSIIRGCRPRSQKRNVYGINKTISCPKKKRDTIAGISLFVIILRYFPAQEMVDFFLAVLHILIAQLVKDIAVFCRALETAHLDRL